MAMEQPQEHGEEVPSFIPAVSTADDERREMQKKTFGKWINAQLEDNKNKVVTDLFHDLRDGVLLLNLLEKLTGRGLRRERGALRVHCLSNVATALNALRDAGVRLVGVNGVDIVDGNPKVTLALVWAVILHWQSHHGLEGAEGEGALASASALERNLLAWCRQSTLEYSREGVDVRDFTSSWRDGLAFCALLHHFRQDIISFEAERRRPDAAARLESAFAAASSALGVPPLLDPEDLNRPDKKSVMTYLMCLFQALPHDLIDLSVLDELRRSQDDSDATAAGDASAGGGAIANSPLKTSLKDLGNGRAQSHFFLNPLPYSLLLFYVL